MGEKYCGKGVMTSAVKKFCKLIFETYDVNKMDAEVFANNWASRKVLEKSGFELEGVHK